MSFEPVIPPGVGIKSASLQAFLNTSPPEPANGQMSTTPVTVQGRIVYARVQASIEAAGTDFQLLWTVIDTAGNIWPRTALVLCARTA